jgi:hypothetical protein
MLFAFLLKCEASNKVEEIIYQTLTNNQEYIPLPHLRIEFQYIKMISLWNLQYVFIPLSLLPLFYKDNLVVRRIVMKLINLLVQQTHHLWIQRCLIMYAKVSDKVVIEELAKLKDKIRAI